MKFLSSLVYKFFSFPHLFKAKLSAVFEISRSQTAAHTVKFLVGNRIGMDCVTVIKCIQKMKDKI